MLSTAQLHNKHTTVVSPTSAKLGEILWFLLKASTTIEELCDPKPPKNENGLAKLSDIEPTEFQKELSGDEIHWWVFKKEDNLDDLGERTNTAHSAVQRLKEDAAKLQSRFQVRSYDELLSLLREFTESHSAEVETLHQYVTWLNQRDPLAPSILFTFRVWGATRRTERQWSGQLASGLESERPEVTRRLTEIVLGLFNSLHRKYTMESVYQEVEMEMAESGYGDEGGVVKPSVSDVVIRTAYEVLGELAAFFEFTRNSLNNILVDIEKQKSQASLMRSDSFWRQFISKTLQPGKSEQQLWDFKSTLKMWHIKATREKDLAEVEFVEDIASFANSSGGVLLIGISNTPVKIDGIGTGVEIERRLNYTRQVLAKKNQVCRGYFLSSSGGH